MEKDPELDRIIREMYEQVCFEEGEQPDWTKERDIFAPDARLVRMNDDGIFEFTLEEYIKDFEKMIKSGTMTSFWEGELWRDTFILGNMAHVLSAYETRRTRHSEVMNRGVNSIQLFRREKSKEPQRWWISAMIWRREGANVRIPDQR
ncbi:MAG: hypothetical protein ACXVH7_04315 [Thermoanaerobaculia bacterium]